LKRVWTETQKAAIESRGTLLVAAGAGSGKTAVLVERIMAYVAEPRGGRDVDEFLVVTFTKAAALEMKTRLRAAIEQRLQEVCEPGLSEHLLTQMLLIDKAQIMTLHALGGDLLRQHFHLLGLEPNFRVMEDTQSRILLRELTENLINEAYEKEYEHDADFLPTAEFFAEGYRDRLLVEMVQQLRQFAMSQPRPRAWLGRLAEAYELEEGEFLESIWGQALLEQSQTLLEESAHALLEAVRLAELPDGPREYLPVLDQDRQNTAMLQKLDRMEFPRLLAQITPGRLSPVRPKNSGRNEEVLEKTKKEAQKSRDIFKQNLDALRKRWINPALADHLAAARPSGRIVRGLVRLTEGLMDDYQEEKRKRNCVDFSDLEHLPLELLREAPELAEMLRQRYHEVLVDEYQDISPVQEELLDMLSRRGHRFMVGDIKQSIYRFRMADPGLFNHKYTSYEQFKHMGSDISKGAPDKAESLQPEDKLTAGESGYLAQERVIDMRHNFRSRPEIVAAVNEIFGRLMRRDTAEIDYDARAELIAAGNFFADEDEWAPRAESREQDPEDDAVEIHIVEQPSKVTETNYTAPVFWDHRDGNSGPEASEAQIDYETLLLDMEAARLEAHIVAQRISQLMREPFLVSRPEGCRPVRYKDIAILKRSASGALSLYREVFAEHGIPLSGAGGAGYFEAVEVEIAESLLSVIDNPHQDIPLLAVLHSFLVGLTPAQLSRVRLICPEGDFFEAVCAVVMFNSQPLASQCAEVLSGFDEEALERMGGLAREMLREEARLADQLSGFFRDLMGWRRLAARETLADFIWRLYQETGILNYVSVMPEGRRRRENLLSLYESAAAFAHFRTQALGDFLRYRFSAQAMNPSRWQDLSSHEEELDEVRFLTIHGSKGLEFPVVFVVGLGSRFNRISQSSKMLLHKDLGIGIAGADIKRKAVYPSPVREAVRWVLTREAAAEEMRVFYVAMTRAKEKLVLVGISKDLAKTLENMRASASRELGTPGAQLSGEQLSSGRVRKAASCLEWLEMAFGEGSQASRICKIIPYRSFDIFKVLLQARKKAAARPSGRKETAGVVTLKNLDEKLLWRYPQEDRLAKVSVTGLKHLLRADPAKVLVYDEEDVPLVIDDYEDAANAAENFEPRVLSAEHRTTPLELGTATHKFLQHIPWRLWADPWGARTEEKRLEILRCHLRDLVERELIPEEVSLAIPLPKVAAFLSSPLGARIFAAEEVDVEAPFILDMLYGVEKQRILVQGTADLIVLNRSTQEGKQDRALVVDFKTDRVKPGREDLLVEKYALQMAVYCLAVGSLLGVEVEEALIYAIHSNHAVAVGADTRRKALRDAGLELAADS